MRPPLKILVFMLIFSDQARSLTVLVPSPKTPSQQFEVALARRHEAESFSQYWLRNRVRDFQRERIQDLFDRAEVARLNDGVEAAQIAFEMVFAARIEADWDKHAQNLIREACLRRADLAQTLNERDQWLGRAAALHSPETLNPKRWSEHLLKLYSQAVKNLKPERLNLRSLYPWADYLLVDGRLFPISQSTLVHRDELLHRFTLLSHRYAPATEYLTWEQLRDWNPIPIPLVSGECDPAEWHKVLKDVDDKDAIWPKGLCQSGGHSQAPTTLSQLRLNPANRNTTSGENDPMAVSPRLTAPSPKKSPHTEPWISNRTILWLGAGILATALAVHYQKQNSQTQSPPIERDGFD